MEVPAEIQLAVSLTRGAVYKMIGKPPFESDRFHHFVVLNFNPTKEEIIIVANGTSQTVRKLTLSSNAALDVAIIPPGKYPFFPKQTAFDCGNSVYQMDFRTLLEKLKKKELEIITQRMDEEDLADIADRVLSSKNHAESIKRPIRPSW